MRDRIRIIILLIVMIVTATIGYAALSTDLTIVTEAEFRVNANIRVNNISYKSVEGSSQLKYESTYTKNTTTSGFVLPDISSSISYDVVIRNNGDVDQAIYGLSTTSNNSGLLVYINDVLVNGTLTQPIIVQSRSNETIKITYKTSTPSEEVINAITNYTFKRVYYVNYDLEGGESSESELTQGQIKYHGVNLSITDKEPTKEGYIFDGWTNVENGQAVVYNPEDTYTTDADLDLYAIYHAAKLDTPTNLAVANTGIVSWTNVENADGYQISIDNVVWTNVPSGNNTTSYNYLEAIKSVKGTRTIYVRATSTQGAQTSDAATINVTTVELSIEKNNNSYGTIDNESLYVITSSTYTSNNNVITLEDGREITATPSNVVGYTTVFTSWSSSSGTISEDTTITANFTRTANTYTVTYNGNGATSGSTATSTHTYDVAKTLTKNGYTRSGYVFNGWNTETNGSGTSYTDEQSVTNLAESGNIDLYAQWVIAPICKRASSLHTETCSNGSSSSNYYCYGDGYYSGGSKNTTTVTYGSLGTSGTLTSGDAFDCDVNGDGTYDSETERFYYVSDRYESGTYASATFDTDYAVLIYDSDLSSGVRSPGTTQAYSTTADIQAVDSNATTYDNIHGPVTAVKHLPTTSGGNAWRDDLLKSSTRSILSETGGTTTSAGNIVSSFSYSGYAARLLTYAEVYSGCYDGSTAITSTGGLSSKCEYLFENTNYTDSTKSSYGPWLETPRSGYSSSVWIAISNGRNVNYTNSNFTSSSGVRPAIEVLKSDIDLEVKSYLITYNANGGSSDSTETISVGDNLGTLPTPTKEYYTLDGWYTGLTDGIKVTSSYTPNSSMTLYARWTFDKYVVTYNYNGSSQSNTTANVTTQGGSTTLPTPNNRAGYKFLGWYTDATEGEEVGQSGESYTPSANVTLYAHWKRITACDISYSNTNTSIPCSSAQCAINYINSLLDGTTPLTEAELCPNTYNPPICKRATTLHTETCSNGSSSSNYYCYADGYYASGSKGTTTITYGSLGTSGTLTSGDAFDCDVNGNGIIDTDTNGNSTERFYYVSDYYDTQSKTVNNDYAVLIYYNNTISGEANTAGSAYATQADAQTVGTCTSSNGCNWYGPVSAIKNLPTTTQWSNVSLYKTSRAILGEYGSTHDATSTSGGTLPTAFSYSGYAARLLTAKELMNGCGLSQVGSYTTGELSGCNYLFENTKYSNSSLATYGPWLETPDSSDTYSVWIANGNRRYVSSSYAYNTYRGARPAIEVLKSDISY